MFNTFFRKFCSLQGNVEKYGTARQATYGTIMLCRKDVLCMPDN